MKSNSPAASGRTDLRESSASLRLERPSSAAVGSAGQTAVRGSGRPCVGVGSTGMAVKLKHFYNPIPNHFALMGFSYWHALDVGGVDAMQLVNDCL